VPGHFGRRVRRHHQVEVLDRVRVHALAQQALCLRDPCLPRLDALAGRRRVRDQQAGHPAGVPRPELERDLPAHGQAHDHGAGHPQAVEELGEVVDERGPLGHRSAAGAVAAQVGHDHPAVRAEVAQLRLPHRPVERVAVHQEQRGVAVRSDVLVRENGPFQCDGAHPLLLSV
jgi:hypothetical protein